MPGNLLPVAPYPGVNLFFRAGQGVDAGGDAPQLACLGAALELARRRSVFTCEEELS